MQVSFIIPVLDQLAFTQAFLASLRATVPSGCSHEIIFVDDGSAEPTRNFLASLPPPCAVLVNACNVGYAASNNRAARVARGEFLALLNNDLVLLPGWLEPMLEAFGEYPRAGVVGNVQLAADNDEVDHAGIVFQEGGYPFHFRAPLASLQSAARYREFPAVTAACCLVRREWFLRGGGFDEGYRNGFEDVDLCLRALADGLTNLVATQSVVRHHISRSSRRRAYEFRNAERFLARWGERTATLEREWTIRDARAFASAEARRMLAPAAEPGIVLPAALRQHLRSLLRDEPDLFRPAAARSLGPLRRLGHWFADRVSTPSRRPDALPTVDAALTSAIDEPDDWQWLHAVGSIRGWVVARSGRSIVGVRLRVAGSIFHGTYYLARPDVAAVFPANPRAFRCGFTVDYELPAERERVFVLEALGEDGNWRVFAAAAGRIVIESGHAARPDYDTGRGRSLIETIRERAKIESLAEKQRPLVSVLMTVGRGGARWLERAIDSVRAQTYPHWELCIAGGAESAEGFRERVNDYSRRDPRIRVIHGSELDRKVSLTNSALASAAGDFAALLDPDDEISPHALAEFVFALVANPELEFVYSDEDKIDERNRRFDPCFKPDWNSHLPLEHKYVQHLAIFRVARMRAIENIRRGFEKSEDWALACRLVEGLAERRIHHIPKILYHVRAVRDRSTGLDAVGGGVRLAAGQ